MELGFRQEGCPFEYGNFNWLSGMQEEVEDKLTLLGSPDGEVSNDTGEVPRTPLPLPQPQLTDKGTTRG